MNNIMTNEEERTYWIKVLDKIAAPVMTSLAAGKLHRQLPNAITSRNIYAPFEAFSRTVCGLGAWLSAPDTIGSEAKLQAKYIGLLYAALDSCTDPSSPDYMLFGGEGHGQPLVDMAFLVEGILQAGDVIIDGIPSKVRRQFIAALQITRTIKPVDTNWILFSVLVEVMLARLGAEFDATKIDYYLHRMMDWYRGDGIYSDGEPVHVDYYNSFVIHPLLLDVVRYYDSEYTRSIKNIVLTRAQRHARTLERLISPDGTFPVLGRSICYRFGAFHLLSEVALYEQLSGISSAQVREGLTEVIRKTTSSTSMFDENGWLNIGFYDHQDDLGEIYINHGSCYFCMTIFLPLGLSPKSNFWISEKQPWTSLAVYSGQSISQDPPIK